MEKSNNRIKAEHPPPPLPDIATRLLEQVRNEASLDEIGMTLSTDPSMAARVLRLANSAALRGATPIGSLSEAFMRIGTEQLRQIVLGLVFIHNFPRRGAFDYRAFWSHSLHVAVASQILENRSGGAKNNSSEIYTAALLHDIGIPCLVFSMATRYRELIAEARASTEPLTVVEQRLLGVDHQEAAAELLTDWRFSPRTIAVARHHSAPRKAPAEHRRCVSVVHAADRLVWSLGIDNGVKRTAAEFEDTVLRAIDVEPADLEKIVAEIRDRAAEIEASLD